MSFHIYILNVFLYCYIALELHSIEGIPKNKKDKSIKKDFVQKNQKFTFFGQKKALDNNLNLEEKKRVKPYIVGEEKDPSHGHPYQLYKTLKEVLLLKNTLNPYSLKDSPSNSSQKTYFLENKLNSKERELISRTYLKSEGRVIDFNQLLYLFRDFKRPNIKIFILSNENYKKNPLYYSHNDNYVWYMIAKKILDISIYDIYTYKDLTLRQFQDKFQNFIKNSKDDDLVIFFYSGHAMINGMPIFIDNKAISSKLFYKYLNQTKSDTLLLGDLSFIKKSFEDKRSMQNVVYRKDKSFYKVQSVGNGGRKKNIYKFYSALRSPKKKEKIFYYNHIYNQQLYNGYKLLENLGIKYHGYGIFTLLCITAFSDFAVYFSDFNLSILGFINLIENKISSFQENNVRIEDNYKYPLLHPKFRVLKNTFLLYRNFVEFGFSVKLKDKVNKSKERKVLPNILKISFKELQYLDIEFSEPYVTSLYNLKSYSKSDYINFSSNLYKEVNTKFINELKGEANLKRNLKKLLLKDVRQNDFQEYNVLKKKIKKLFKIEKKENIDIIMDYLIEKYEYFFKNNSRQEYKNRASKLLYNLNFSYGLDDAIRFNNLGNRFFMRKKYNLAYNYYMKSLNIKKTLNISLRFFINTYNNLGALFFMNKRYKNSIESFQKCFNLFKRHKVKSKLLKNKIINNIKILMRNLRKRDVLDNYRKKYSTYDVFKVNIS